MISRWSAQRYIQSIAAVILLMNFSGCHTPRYFATPSDTMFLLADYQDALKLWTAHDEIHHKVIGVADLTGVYISWEVRQAYLQEITRSKNLPEEQLDRIIQREHNKFESGHEFLIGLYCYKKDWNRLQGVDPIWRISLCSDTGGPVEAGLIEEYVIPTGEDWMYLEFLTSWRKVYRVVFPLSDAQNQPLINSATRCVTFKCDSILGNLTLNWKLGPVPGKLQ
jgi:hypothetical protein